MSEVIEQAVNALKEKMSAATFDGTAKFSIEAEGSVIVDNNGVRAGDDLVLLVRAGVLAPARWGLAVGWNS